MTPAPNPPRNPFAVLGLPEWPDLEDETVRAAWQAIAAATHPGRADGGDLARYTQACAAFAELNTAWGRSEAYADLAERAWLDGRYDDYPLGEPGADPDGPDPYGPDPYGPDPYGPDPYGPGADAGLPARRGQPWQLPPPLWLADPRGMLLDIPYRLRQGHPVRLVLRAAVTAGACLAMPHLIRSSGAVGYLVLVLIAWFALTVHHDLAPSPRL